MFLLKVWNVNNDLIFKNAKAGGLNGYTVALPSDGNAFAIGSPGENRKDGGRAGILKDIG